MKIRTYHVILATERGVGTALLVVGPLVWWGSDKYSTIGIIAALCGAALFGLAMHGYHGLKKGNG